MTNTDRHGRKLYAVYDTNIFPFRRYSRQGKIVAVFASSAAEAKTAAWGTDIFKRWVDMRVRTLSDRGMKHPTTTDDMFSLYFMEDDAENARAFIPDHCEYCRGWRECGGMKPPEAHSDIYCVCTRRKPRKIIGDTSSL